MRRIAPLRSLSSMTVVAAGLCLWPVSPSLVNAQGRPQRVVSGFVRDSTRAPIRLAVVESILGQKVAADDSGRFELKVPANESLTLHIRRI